MDASGESEEKVLLPSQETQQQHRNSRETAPQGLAARARSLPAEVLDERGGRRPAKPPAKEAELDEARFTAGIVQLYETVLKEPIPGKMLRLIEEIAKRERRS